MLGLSRNGSPIASQHDHLYIGGVRFSGEPSPAHQPFSSHLHLGQQAFGRYPLVRNNQRQLFERRATLSRHDSLVYSRLHQHLLNFTVLYPEKDKPLAFLPFSALVVPVSFHKLLLLRSLTLSCNLFSLVLGLPIRFL